MYPPPESPSVIGIPDQHRIAPLITGLDQRHDITLKTWPSDALAAALQGGACGCAFITPTLLFHIPGLRVLPGVGLVAREQTPTECLVTAHPPERIHRIAVAPNAAHLKDYVRLLFAARGLTPPDFVPSDEAGAAADAALVSEPAAPGTPIINLGALWKETTGLPLVLGVWACTAGAPGRQLRQILGEAARRGEEAQYLAMKNAPAPTSPALLYFRLLSRECESLRALATLAARHTTGETTEESIVFW